MDFYVYAHFRATDGRLFYIGKGSGRRAWSKSSRNRHWHCVVAKHGRRVRLLRVGLSEAEAFRAEALLIAARKECLATYTAGGAGIAGYRHTDRAKSAMSEKRTGKRASDAARAAMSDAIRTRPDLIAQRAASFTGANNPSQKPANREASRARMKAANPMSSAAVREKMATAKRGRPLSAEARLKISAALKGRHRGPVSAKVAEALAKVREANKRPVVTACGLRFASTADAARATGARQGNIVNNCAGRAKSAGGLKWSYANED